MARVITQICAPLIPTWAAYEDKDCDAGCFYVAVDLWALSINEDGDSEIVGIEMKDMHYVIDEDPGFRGYTNEPPSDDLKGRV